MNFTQERYEPSKTVSVPRSNAAVPGSAEGQSTFFSVSFTFGVLPLLLVSEHDLLLTLPAVPSSASDKVYHVCSLFVD